MTTVDAEVAEAAERERRAREHAEWAADDRYDDVDHEVAWSSGRAGSRAPLVARHITATHLFATARPVEAPWY